MFIDKKYSSTRLLSGLSYFSIFFILLSGVAQGQTPRKTTDTSNVILLGIEEVMNKKKTDVEELMNIYVSMCFKENFYNPELFKKGSVYNVDIGQLDQNLNPIAVRASFNYCVKGQEIDDEWVEIFFKNNIAYYMRFSWDLNKLFTPKPNLGSLNEVYGSDRASKILAYQLAYKKRAVEITNPKFSKEARDNLNKLLNEQSNYPASADIGGRLIETSIRVPIYGQIKSGTQRVVTAITTSGQNIEDEVDTYKNGIVDYETKKAWKNTSSTFLIVRGIQKFATNNSFGYKNISITIEPGGKIDYMKIDSAFNEDHLNSAGGYYYFGFVSTTSNSTVGNLFELSTYYVPAYVDNANDLVKATHKHAQELSDNGHYSQAFDLELKGAEYNYPPSQNMLGIMFQTGQGVQKNIDKAIEWYYKAAKQGCAEAEYNLACIYFNKESPLFDYKLAFRWFNKGAEHGYPAAEAWFGYMIDNGLGTEYDEYKALQWYLKAANDGNPIGQWFAGYAEIYGHYFKDYDGHKWVKLAAKNGVQPAIDWCKKWNVSYDN
jgi:TPR repeat protein